MRPQAGVDRHQRMQTTCPWWGRRFRLPTAFFRSSLTFGAPIGNARPPYCTLNGSALLVPAAVATVTLRDPRAAVPPTRKVAVTVAGFTTTRLLTDMPAPSTFTVAGVVKLAPLIVTATVAPRLARFGVSELSIGLAATGAVTANDFDAPHGGP